MLLSYGCRGKPSFSLFGRSGLLMKYRPYINPSYCFDSTASHELVSLYPPAAKKGVSPKILRNEVKSMVP